MKSLPISNRQPLRLLALAVPLLLLTVACRPRAASHPAPAAPPIRVQTASAHVVAEPLRQELPATVRPADRAVLAAKVMGVIAEFSLQLGQRVEQGELIARISAGEIAARVEQARAADRQAARDLQRETELLARNAATAESVRALEDRLMMTRALLAEAETMYSYTRILAPFSGVVARKLANEGDLAAPGQPLVEIERSGALRLELDIPDGLARHLRVGASLEADLDGTRVQARLAEISAAADPRTRTVAAKLDLPVDAPARSGMFARVFVPAETVQRIRVPATALSSHGQIERVFVVADGRAQLRVVRSGARRGAEVEIVAGLAAGERVIVNPPATLRNGQPVESGS
jgi:RND family efflux transporter MFP subunit